MKLRNKKTGEIIEGKIEIPSYGEYAWRQYNFDSIAELNKDWEDYTPKEPLIKDDKVRKAVRAWYDLNTNKDFAVFCEDACTLSIAHSARIEFLEKVFGNIKRDYGYPITELCGGEKNDGLYAKNLFQHI